MREVKITCDHCGKDLTTIESGFDEYRLVLSSQRIHNTSETTFGMGDARLQVKHDLYFCNLKCLKAWATEPSKK